MNTTTDAANVTLPLHNSTIAAVTITDHLILNITTTPVLLTNNESNITPTSTLSSTFCCSESEDTPQNGFNLSTDTTTTAASLPEHVHKFQRTIWTQDEFGSFVPYDESSYTTPTAILLLNFFLVTFLLIVLMIAVYPAVKKYCDSTFFVRRGVNNRYWIEDNEEVVSVLTSSIPECSFALLNSSIKNIKVAEDDSSSACSLEILTEQVRSDLA